ncbi:MAG TPA: DUF5683 domain-containing protein, partial [candidate division Zixibacteria bacterium]|nr:DUF5683 domain-containing protein [candidate division Zixibacteria bacterium]
MIRLDGRKLAMLCMMAVCVLMLAQPAPANEAATSESADGVGTLDGLRAGRIPTMLDAGATDPLTLAANGLDETYWAQSGIDMGDDVDIYGFEKKSPRRAFLQSFLIPGWGQYYARGAWWKTVAFLGIEAASIYGAINFNSNGNDMEAEYEAFADAHWSGKDYVIGLKQVFYPNNEDAWDFRVEGTDTTYNWAIDTMLYTILVQGEFGQEPEERRWSH